MHERGGRGIRGPRKCREEGGKESSANRSSWRRKSQAERGDRQGERGKPSEPGRWRDQLGCIARSPASRAPTRSAADRPGPRRIQPRSFPRLSLGHSPHFSEPRTAPLSEAAGAPAPQPASASRPRAHSPTHPPTRTWRGERRSGGPTIPTRPPLPLPPSPRRRPDPRRADTSTKMAATPESAWLQPRGRGYGPGWAWLVS